MAAMVMAVMFAVRIVMCVSVARIITGHYFVKIMYVKALFYRESTAKLPKKRTTERKTSSNRLCKKVLQHNNAMAAMDKLQQLYQQVILDHNKNPRNFGKLESATFSADGVNPLCGDQIHVDLTIESGVISDIKFSGAGCAISKSSASIMTTMLKGKTPEEAEHLFEEFHELVTHDGDEPVDEEVMGKLAVFSGVREFPSRVKCASLAWHTLRAALRGQREASTEDKVN